MIAQAGRLQGSRSLYYPMMDRLIESFFSLPYVRACLTTLACLVTAMLLVRIWTVHRDRSLLAKIGWSLVVCVPLVGWVLYGGLAATPLPHRSRPQHWESDGLG